MRWPSALTDGTAHAIVAEWGMILLSAAAVMSVTHGRAATVLSWRPLVMVGTISYGVYVWHQLVPKIVPFLETTLDISLYMPSAEDGWARLGYVTLATLALATLSWFLFEKPLNDLRTRIPYVRQPSGVARLEHVRQS
jgi:peptidoglycan/LPS O-acetylase OafA/YrhL